VATALAAVRVESAVSFQLRENAAHHGSRNRQALAAQEHGEFVLAPAGKLQAQRQNLFCERKSPSRLALAMRTMRARFQRAQVQRIIAALPAIESLAADAEVTAGTGRVVTVAIEIHPGQPNPGFPAELHAGPSQSARTACFPVVNLHTDPLCECH